VVVHEPLQVIAHVALNLKQMECNLAGIFGGLGKNCPIRNYRQRLLKTTFGEQLRLPALLGLENLHFT
jgi:hypothetical protein